jgi:hypothetical protein
MRRLRLVFLALILAFTSGVLVVSAQQAEMPTLSTLQQTGTPTLSCPAGYSLSDTFTIPFLVREGAGTPTSWTHGFSFAQPTNTVLSVWSMVGHPELGCLAGEGNDGGKASCDDTSQTREEFFILVDGSQVAYVPDHGTDQWQFFGEVNLGTLAAGNHIATFDHTDATVTGSPESVTYLTGLCTSAVPTPPPPPPPPPPGDQGCTPGYWKQPQHAYAWPIANMDFDDAFGLVGNPTGSNTLLSALGANGGGVNALMRHAAAALLNAYSDGVNYALIVDQVKTTVHQAFASGNYEGAKDALAALNDRYCPLN